MALPGIFDPVNLHGRLLVDGGLRNNVPADIARSLGADVVLAVDISVAGTVGRRDDPALASRWTIANDMWRSQVILMRAVTECKLKEAAPEVLIRPALPEGVTAVRGAARLTEIIAAGERAAAAAVPRLRAALEGVPPYAGT
jgi:NTE family protein